MLIQSIHFTFALEDADTAEAMLRELREASIVDATPGAGYRLTSEGQELLASLIPLDTWAERWAERAGEAGRELTSTSPASTSAA